MAQIKIHLVGDGAVGKTTLIHTFIDGVYEDNFNTFHDVLNKKIVIDDESKKKEVNLEIWDLVGAEMYYSVRPLRHSNDDDVVLLCFSLVYPKTLEKITEWTEEIRKGSNAPIILVGTMSDLGGDPNSLYRYETISDSEAMKIAEKIGAIEYIPCSSKNLVNVDQVFETATKIGIKHQKERIRKQSNLNKLNCRIAYISTFV